MKYHLTPLYCVLTVVLLVGCSGSKDSAAPDPDPSLTTETPALLSYQDAITPGYLRTHLQVFAADSMEGRETGMPGQKKAARYLTEEYRKLGLKPVGDNNSYLQHFDLTARRTDSIGYTTYRLGPDSTKERVSRAVARKGAPASYHQQYGAQQTVTGEIVFAGYGLQNDSLGINQLQGADLQGKWVMVFQDLPQVVDGDTLYRSQRRFSQSWLRNMLQRQVAGILMIPGQDAGYQQNAAEDTRRFGEPSGMQLAYRERGEQGPGWSLTVVSRPQAAELLAAGSMDSLAAVEQAVAENMQSFGARATGFGLTQQPYVEDMTIETENVVALLEGADPQLKDEVVVLSAHYDHVGIGTPDSTGDAIYNGANDDGSGTIGVLSAARAFAEAKANGVAPRRSILFLSVSGEEKGLLGSRYYSDHPIYPIEKTVANINTDMIGRVDPEHQQQGVTDYVYIIGGEIISSQLDSLLKAGNARAGNLQLDMRYNDLTDPNQFYRRSDHWNFGRFGVPFVFFFNGVHEDYHRPSDEVEKINFELMAKTARSMYAATVMVANADRAPQVDNQEFIEITKEQAR